MTVNNVNALLTYTAGAKAQTSVKKGLISS